MLAATVGPARAAAPYPRLLGRPLPPALPGGEESACAREPAKLTVGLSVATGGERAAASLSGWHAQVPAKIDVGCGGPASAVPAKVGVSCCGPPGARGSHASQGPLGPFDPPCPQSPQSPQRRAAAFLATSPLSSGGADPDACCSPTGLADASQRLSPADRGQLLMWPAELPCQPLEQACSPHAPPAAAVGIAPPPGLPVPQVGGKEVGPLAASCHHPGQGDRRFTCKFIFVGIHADRDASFEIVPRLIGRGGCNMRTISEACGGKVRVRGRGSGHRECSHSRRRSAEADVPLQIALSCRDQPSLDQGRALLTQLLAGISDHFARYCRSRGFEPPTEKSPLFSVVLGA